MKYQVIDIQTREVIGTYSTAKRAYHRADKLDSEYGVVRYIALNEEPIHFGYSLLLYSFWDVRSNHKVSMCKEDIKFLGLQHPNRCW